MARLMEAAGAPYATVEGFKLISRTGQEGRWQVSRPTRVEDHPGWNWAVVDADGTSSAPAGTPSRPATPVRICRLP